jgi:hypothetical protein
MIKMLKGFGYIENNIRPSRGRKVHSVIDFLTDEIS